MNKFVLFLLLVAIGYSTNLTKGEKVFRKYCWGCHHQTSLAFGPSFSEIASKRTKEQIISHIMAPKGDYKNLGYSRSVMPSFAKVISNDELYAITQYILSFKGK
jgi:mono/diheme cytochrome c family protein